MVYHQGDYIESITQTIVNASSDWSDREPLDCPCSIQVNDADWASLNDFTRTVLSHREEIETIQVGASNITNYCEHEVWKQAEVVLTVQNCLVLFLKKCPLFFIIQHQDQQIAKFLAEVHLYKIVWYLPNSSHSFNISQIQNSLYFRLASISLLCRITFQKIRGIIWQPTYSFISLTITWITSDHLDSCK